MRILLDCRSVSPAMGGIGRVAAALARHLPAHLQREDSLELLLGPRTPADWSAPPGVEEVVVDSAMIDPVFDQVLLPGLLEDRAVDVYHGTCFSTPIAAGNTARVATVHDVVFRRHPELVEPTLREFLDRWTRVSCEVAEAVVTVSEFSRLEIVACFGRAAEQIDVVPNGVDERFSSVARHSAPGLPYVLYVGALEPKKNVLALLRAFRVLCQTTSLPHVLVLVGGDGGAPFDLAQALSTLGNLASRVHALGRVSDQALLELLGAADLFVYPSEYEGFGLPPLEAMAAGVPTIVSDRASLPEVVGHGAVVVDPHEESRFAAAMTRLLTEPGARDSLVRRGRRRAHEFSWSEAAARLVGVYRRAHLAKSSPQLPTLRVLAGGGRQ